MLALKRLAHDRDPGLRARIVLLLGILVSANVLLWALTLITATRYPLLLGLGITAFGFGLRHAVDADHIAAIDNVTRRLLQTRRKPVTVGLYFSLGHSTVVLILALLVAAGSSYLTNSLNDSHSALKQVGGLIGTGVSATFLFVIAALNCAILLDIVRTFRRVTRGEAYDAATDEALLTGGGGLLTRWLRPLFRGIDASWKMYPLGFLFGLGFDTATEIGLLGVAGTAGSAHLPFYTVALLPLLFMAGMTLADSLDGVLMLGAYGWAQVRPVRKLFYNLSITLVSVLAAVGIGTLEVLQLLAQRLGLRGGFWDAVAGLSIGSAGLGIVGIFIVSWLVAAIIYRRNRYDELEHTLAQRSPPGAEEHSPTPAQALERRSA